MKSFMDALSTFGLSLHGRDSRLYSSALHWLMLANGDADFHDNIILFGFQDEWADPVLVAKVPRSIQNGWMLQVEYDRLVDLWNCLGEEAAHYLPRPYAMTTLQERPALVISYVSGESLTRLSRRSFWGNGKQVSALGVEAARSLRHLNDRTAKPIQPGEVIDSDFQKVADKFRELFQVNNEQDQALSDLVKVVNDSRVRASHKVLIQGDFWHGNMIREGKYGRLKFVDWQFARWTVDVSLDVYFFLLAGALSASGIGSPEQRVKDAYRILTHWRADVIPKYLSAYGKPDRYILLPAKYGMMVCCVEKAVRPALEFGYSHPDDLAWRHLFAELVNWPDED